MKKIFEKVAKEYNTVPEEVQKEMAVAIKAAMACEDPEKRKNWNKLFPENKEPSPEEFIATVIREIASNKKQP